MYLLPAVDILDGKVVRLKKGAYDQVTVYSDDPVAQACAFEEAGAAWIHIVDLDGARSGNPSNASVVEAIVRNTGLYAEIGGGVRSMEALDRLIQAGATRVVLGTALVRDPDFAQTAIKRYGDALAAGIDAKDGEVAVQGWQEGTGLSATEFAARMAHLGYRHLVYTDIARDGMQVGLDPSAYTRMAHAFGHPVIASGGVAGISDIKQLASVACHIEGVIAGRAIYEGSLDVAEACDVLQNHTEKLHDSQAKER